VRWPSGVAVESYPAPVPDLYAGEPVVVKARLSDAARDSDLIVIGGTSALGGWSAELPLDIEEQGAGVAALWARAKIENLMDQSRRSPGEANFRQAVTETALAYHLVSKYTSLVAVDKTPQRPQHAGLSKEQLASLLPHGQVHEAIFGFPAGATAAPLHQLAGVVCLLAALFFLLLARRSRVLPSLA
jgi:Ca-activated chloride channel family protein